MVALGALIAVAAAITIVVGGIARQRSGASHVGAGDSGLRGAPRSPSVANGASNRRARLSTTARFAVGLTVMTLVDPTRSVTLPDGNVAPRTVKTYVRYPALGPAGRGDHVNAPPARAQGPFPLIVFGHGFAVTPQLYARLLRAWVRAGYIVAAPVFPLENANAPGGPNESDLPNQPADMSLVISRMLSADHASSGPLRGLIAARKIAVAGQSDGGDTALAVAYDPRYRDGRVDAAIILSGAEIPGIGGFQIASGGPPLLAVQGTADTVNLPSATDAFYDTARVPKYRLELLGASHLPPYSKQQPELRIVERVTTAFLDRYLKHIAQAQQRLMSSGDVPRVAVLSQSP